MAVQVQLLTSSSPQSLRERLLDRFSQAAQGQAGSALWIGPTPEAIDEVRGRLAAAAAIVAPLLFDWESLSLHVVRRLNPKLKPLTPTRQRLLLQETIAAAKKQKRLQYFDRIASSRGFADSLAGLIAELGAAGIDPDRFVLAASTDGGTDSRSRKRRDAALLIRQYQAVLQYEGAYDPSDLMRRASECELASLFPGVVQLFVDAGGELSSTRLAILRQFVGEKVSGTFSAKKVPDTFSLSFSLSGLRHLRQALFSADAHSPSADANGLSLIEAPGALGEARLIARRIRKLLSEGIAAERIVVAARQLTGSRDLLAEVFDEYAVPFDLEGDEPLARDPQVKTLLKAARLCEDNWPFEGVTALLRNTLVRLSGEPDAESPRRTEALLRMIGAPRGREAVLRAVNVWADNPPEALEDEDAEEPLRLKKTRLAGEVRPFLQRFFKCWDRFPLHALAEQYVQALRSFASEFSLFESPASNENAMAGLFRELDGWAAGVKQRSFSRAGFFQILETLASAPQQVLRSSSGRVRIRRAETAAELEADCLFILGLGENSFPDLSPPDSLLDDADRHHLRQKGISLSEREERLPREMLLFQRLISIPTQELILSFPAVDPKGQPLLPSSFLRGVRDCFSEDAIPVERQHMLLEGYFQRPPLAESELRVRVAAAMADRWPENEGIKHPQLPNRLVDHLAAAARMAHSRFRSREFGVYDGMLAQAKIVRKLHDKFGPNKTFSPTALEAYVACPFKFFLGSVLRLQELDEVVEEVEASRRGSAFHRALARFHRELLEDKELQPNDLDEGISKQLEEQLDVAIDEYMNRAPSDAASVLWRLEGIRLKRFAARYREHWQVFAQPWHEKKVLPLPLHLEADFGLPRYSPQGGRLEPENPPLVIQAGDVDVRIGGRIDRVDVAELQDGVGFWIIDYKTGLAMNYTSKDLAQFKKLQLGLYALAVERVFLKDRKARPLGLAYWMVTDTGPRVAAPNKRFDWLFEPESWQRFRRQLEEWVATLADQIRNGRFPLAPRSEFCTSTCQFSQICRIAQSRETGKIFDLALPGNQEESEPS